MQKEFSHRAHRSGRMDDSETSRHRCAEMRIMAPDARAWQHDQSGPPSHQTDWRLPLLRRLQSKLSSQAHWSP